MANTKLPGKRAPAPQKPAGDTGGASFATRARSGQQASNKKPRARRGAKFGGNREELYCLATCSITDSSAGRNAEVLGFELQHQRQDAVIVVERGTLALRIGMSAYR